MDNAHPESVVVFDFDHTLTDFDTGSAFFAWLLKRGKWRIALLVTISPLLVPLLALRQTRKWPLRVAVWAGTLWRSQPKIDALCKEFASERSAAGFPVLRQCGIQCAQWHLSQGHTVIVATGTLASLATALLGHTELKDVIVVGSSMKRFLFGMVAHEHCYGKEKVRMLEQRGFAGPWLAGYTDHASDFSLLENSRERYLVNPKPKAATAYEAQFNAKPNILHWN